MRRQSTEMETQSISLEAATAGCRYNMAAALVATAALNLFNKSSSSSSSTDTTEKTTPWTKKKGR